MNKIEKEIEDILNGYISSDCLVRGISISAEKCLSIIYKYAVGFSKWQTELVFTENSNFLKEKTTKELYELYLKTLF